MEFSTTFSRRARWQFMDFGDFEFLHAHLPVSSKFSPVVKRFESVSGISQFVKGGPRNNSERGQNM
jgi:hypothetical protein